MGNKIKVITKAGSTHRLTFRVVLLTVMMTLGAWGRLEPAYGEEHKVSESTNNVTETVEVTLEEEPEIAGEEESKLGSIEEPLEEVPEVTEGVDEPLEEDSTIGTKVVADKETTIEVEIPKTKGKTSKKVGIQELNETAQKAVHARLTGTGIGSARVGALTSLGISGLTNRVIGITVAGEDSENVQSIDMVSSPSIGRNYASNLGYDSLLMTHYSLFYPLYNTEDIKGKELSVSFEARTLEEGEEAVLNAILYGGNSYPVEANVTDEYQKFYYTIPKDTNPSDLDRYNQVELKRGDVTKTLEIKKLQVELGDTVTPYTLAPENVKDEGNKNLFDKEEWIKTTQEEKPKTSGVPYINIKLEPNTEYTLSTDMKRQDGVEGYYDVFVMNSKGEASSYVNGVGSGNPRTVKTLEDGIVKVAMRGYDSSLREGTKFINLNKGTSAIPLDSKVKTYPVTANGWYTFKVTYKDGTTKDMMVNVANFVTIKGRPYKWTDANVTLTLDATGGETSKVTRIQLPDKSWVNGDTASYRVTDNGTYTFVAEDKDGNKLTDKVLIDKIDKGKPTITASHSPTSWTNKAVDIKVLAYDAESGIDKLEMTGRPTESTGGGDNLFLNSNFMFGKNNWSGGELNGLFEVKDKTLSASGSGRFIYSIISMPVGEYYTVSFDARKDGEPAKVKAFQSGNDGKWESTTYNTIGNEWSRYTQKIKIANTNTVSFSMQDEGNIYQFRNMKLEKGQIATPWVPAIADGIGSGDTVFPVATNGKYTFTATDYAGNATEVVHEVTNIDSTAPIMTVTKNIKGYTTDKSMILTYNVTDEKSGVKKITLPDGKEITNQTSGSFTVNDNGEYDFILEDNVGNSITHTENITQFDREAPTLTITGNPKDWTGEDTVTLTVKATDTQSGVQSIKLPNNKVVYGSDTTYAVNENGTYEFSVTDNVGNTSKHTEIVDKIMIPYTFYIYDSGNKPLKGAGFALIRDGIEYTTAESDKDGLVNFGKVPPVGKYTIKQIKAPDGYIIDPTEKEVEVGDTTEPEEFISYPRGEVLPATGTNGITVTLLVSIAIVGMLGVVSYVRVNKSRKVFK